MIDIIVCVLNEEKILREKKNYYLALAKKYNLIFVDGGSEDQTVEIASQYSQVLSTRPGRSYQKNFGAQHSQSQYLLFLNVDSFIDIDSMDDLLNAFGQGANYGSFTMSIMDEKPIFRLYEKIVNFRARKLGIVDADLGLFIKRSVFEEMGGFDPLIIMDDIVFSKRLKNQYPISVLSNTISVSSRKWHEQGFVKTFSLYTLAYLQLWTGIEFFKDTYQSSNEPNRSVNHICT